MREIIALAILGLGAGSVYGLLAQGLVVIYRGSGVINFAQGAVAMVGAYVLYQFTTGFGWPTGLAIVFVVALAGLFGALFQLFIMHPMRNGSGLTRLVATLAALTILESIIDIKYGSSPLTLPSLLPTSTVHLPFQLYIGADKLVLFGIGLLVTVLLSLMYRYTQFGRRTAAVAENYLAASAMGCSPNRIAAINWAVGSALAGLGGCLIAPITGLDIGSLTNLVIPAVAAGVVAKFRSFPAAFGAALVLGIAEAEVTTYVSAPGWGDAIPFLAIMVWLSVRGTSLPLRNYIVSHLPAVSPGTFKRRYLVVALALLLLCANLIPAAWDQALLISLLAATVGLSVVVVTGYAGQISLAQYGLAGLGGLFAALIVIHVHLSLIPAMIIASLATAVVGAIIALPAIRTRGINLAIITLCAGVVISEVVLGNINISGAENGLYVGTPTLFGWPIGTVTNMDRYVSVVAVLFMILVFAVLNLRRSPSGRRMIAIRDNERAAAAVGVNVPAMKLSAFTIAAFIAAVGGVLAVVPLGTATFTTGFDDFSSMSIIELVVLGGIGFASGAVVGSLLVVGGLISQLLSGWSSINAYLPLIGGVAIIVQLIVFPDGIAPGNIAIGRAIWNRMKPDRRWAVWTRVTGRASASLAVGDAAEPLRSGKVPPHLLQVRDLRVAFGGVVAVDGVNLDLKPGEVVGLIGPNGAGKTTVIDAISGLVRSTGDVRLGDDSIATVSAYVRSAKGLSRSFQSVELFDDLTVRENLAVACENWRLPSLVRDLGASRAPALSDTARAAVAEFGLSSALDQRPGQLSFARRRLVDIARAVASGPSVLLLDEPGAGLDAQEVRELSALVRGLADDWGMAVLLIEHHMDLVTATCDRLIVLTRGKVLAEGRPDDVLRDSAVRYAYTGVGEQTA